MKDISKKRRGVWWQGWVRFTYSEYDGGPVRDSLMWTQWEYATAGQAKRAAEILAGGLAAPRPIMKSQRRYVSKTEDRSSRFTIIETGVEKNDK